MTTAFHTPSVSKRSTLAWYGSSLVAALDPLTRRRPVPLQRPAHRLGVDPKLFGDVFLVDTAVMECFNHDPVLLA